jgi:uncharacterized protein YkwD
MSQPADLASTNLQSGDVPTDVLEQSTFERVNQERVEQGLAPLRKHDHLTQAARQHSRDMAERDYMGHTNPDGYKPADRARLAGVRRARHIAENLGKHRAHTDPVVAIVRNWMNSPGHRENILNPRFKYTGIGVVRAADGTVYFTQLFADR